MLSFKYAICVKYTNTTMKFPYVDSYIQELNEPKNIDSYANIGSKVNIVYLNVNFNRHRIEKSGFFIRLFVWFTKANAIIQIQIDHSLTLRKLIVVCCVSAFTYEIYHYSCFIWYKAALQINIKLTNMCLPLIWTINSKTFYFFSLKKVPCESWMPNPKFTWHIHSYWLQRKIMFTM